MKMIAKHLQKPLDLQPRHHQSEQKAVFGAVVCHREPPVGGIDSRQPPDHRFTELAISMVGKPAPEALLECQSVAAEPALQQPSFRFGQGQQGQLAQEGRARTAAGRFRHLTATLEQTLLIGPLGGIDQQLFAIRTPYAEDLRRIALALPYFTKDSLGGVVAVISQQFGQLEPDTPSERRIQTGTVVFSFKLVRHPRQFQQVCAGPAASNLAAAIPTRLLPAFVAHKDGQAGRPIGWRRQQPDGMAVKLQTV